MLQPTDRILAKIIAMATADMAFVLDPNMENGSAEAFAKSILRQTKGNPNLSDAVWGLINEVGEEAFAEATGTSVRIENNPPEPLYNDPDSELDPTSPPHDWVD